ACYRRGGTLPTVTDADVVLGLLRPDSFLGGRMPLDENAARAAVGALAAELGLGLEETAAGIVPANTPTAAPPLPPPPPPPPPDPPAGPGARPGPARLRAVLLRRGGAGARVRLRGRDRGAGGADPARQRRVHAVRVRHRGRRRHPVHRGRDGAAGAVRGRGAG